MRKLLFDQGSDLLFRSFTRNVTVFDFHKAKTNPLALSAQIGCRRDRLPLASWVPAGRRPDSFGSGEGESAVYTSPAAAMSRVRTNNIYWRVLGGVGCVEKQQQLSVATTNSPLDARPRSCQRPRSAESSAGSEELAPEWAWFQRGSFPLFTPATLLPSRPHSPCPPRCESKARCRGDRDGLVSRQSRMKHPRRSHG